ncbi:hypothetical protein VLK31_02805 [Variovorax sp. H27-G14]|uniref:hypothetical protein n=1 Tax=Variovorax sp. H27-G14 TaxID=3111914 RepID=UPI0038FCEA77
MKIIVEIEGQEAIPVRAIPLATDRESMRPEEIADVLAEQDERSPAFGRLAPAAEADSTALSASEPGQIEPTTDGEFSSATWWGGYLEAAYWWDQPSITPLEAALLLCGLDPHVESKDSAEKLATPGEPSGRDFKMMLRSFEGAEIAGQLRTMRKWLGIAMEQGLKRHSWLAEWVAARQPALPEQEAEGNAAPQSVKANIDGAETLRETDQATAQASPRVAASQERLDAHSAVAVHSTKKPRSDIINAVIAEAEASCGQDATVATKWLTMIKLTENRGKPFLELLAGSIRYKDNMGQVRSFGQKNLADRLRRSRRKTIAPQA